MDAQKSLEPQPQGRGRGGWLGFAVVPLVLLLTAGGGGLVLLNEARSRRSEEQERARQELDRLLRQARELGAAYVSQRQAERTDAQERLAALANAVASDVQARLQTAIADRQMRVAREAALRSQRAAERLAEEKRALVQQREREQEELAKYKKLVLELLRAQPSLKPSALGEEEEDESGLAARPPVEEAEILLPAEIETPALGSVGEHETGGGLRKGTEPPGEEVDAAGEGLTVGDVPSSESGGVVEAGRRRPTGASHWARDADRWQAEPDDADWPERLLAKCGRDLATLVKPGCVLTVTNELGHSVLRLGAEEPETQAMVAESERTFLFPVKPQARRWRLRVQAYDVRVPPPPAPRELAERLESDLALGGRSDIRGVLYEPNGEPLLLFPADAPSTEQLALPPKLGSWTRTVSRGAPKVTRLDTLPDLHPCSWRIGMQMAVPDPALWVRVQRMLEADARWAGLVAAAVLLTLGSLVAGGLGLRRRRSARRESKRRGRDGPRLVRRDGGRVVSEDAKIVVAEVGVAEAADEAGTGGEEGTVRVRFRPGSLKRLQATHRGSAHASGSRILDHARSPMLRALVTRVRPTKPRTAGTQSEGEPSQAAAGGGAARTQALAEARQALARHAVGRKST